MGISATVQAKFDLARKCKDEFQNWPSVLLRAGFCHLGWSQGVFTVSTRGRLTLQAPNHRMSWFPIVEVLADDAYRLRHLSWEHPLTRRNVLDVGAHVGSFACAISARLPAATFTCVEPLPSALAWLNLNLARNGLTQRTTVVPAAVADTDGEAEFYAPEDASCSASLTPGVGPAVTVRTMTLDSIVAAYGRPDIVKLDCEGGEYAAILESSSAAWATVEQLFVEYHPVAGHYFEELPCRLSQLGLRLVWHHPFARLPGQGIAYFARSRQSREVPTNP